MAWQKPWEKEFNDLLERLHNSWGGNIVRNDSKIYSYSIYKGEYRDYKLLLMISEYPYPTGDYIEGNDNVEYIQLQILGDFKYQIFIRAESWWDRFQKFIGLQVDYQTGKEDFDKKYLLHIGSGNEKHLVNDFSFQEQIKALDPFGSITMKESYFMITRQVRDKEQLTLANIENLTNRAIELIEYANRKQVIG